MTNTGGGGFREHYNAARDFAISAAVLIFFLGLVYVYYYFRSFGVSLVSVQISPQQYYLFAYGVLTHDAGKTLSFVAILLILIICYAFGVDALASVEQAQAIQDQTRVIGKLSATTIPRTPTEKVVTPPVYSKLKLQSHVTPDGARSPMLRLLVMRVLLTGFGVVIVIVPFPIAFWWAHTVAAQDVASRYLTSHEESSRFLKLVENVSTAKATPEFTATIDKINAAGNEGRAVQIAETGDRIFILVGATVGPTDDAALQLPNDRVFAVSKSLVAVEDIWQKQEQR